MDRVVVLCADLQSVFQDIQGNVIAIIGVEVRLVGMLWLGGFKYYFEITRTRSIDFRLTGPPVKRLLVVRPGHSPVHLIPSRPKEIGQRLLRFDPHQIAFLVLVVRANQFFELLLRLIKLRRVRGCGAGLRAPRRVGQTEFDPAGLCRR